MAKKPNRRNMLTRTAGLAVGAGAAYFALGSFLHSQLLSRKAGSRGFAGRPTEDILAGRDGVAEKAPSSWLDNFVGNLLGDASGLGDFYNKPYFSCYQAGVKWYTEQERKQVVTISPRGERLHAEVILNEKPSNLWLIGIHGLSSCPRDYGGLVKVFHEWGFNALLPHLCGHGESESKAVSMGWLDRIDICAWIDYLNREYDNPRIVLHGTSMGGAAVMMTTGEPLPDNVICAIEDCGYTSVVDEFATQARGTLRLGPLIPIGLSALDTIVRMKSGFSIKEASCVEQVKKSRTPTLFIHGDADEFVPFRMLQEVYDAAACEKELLVIPGAGHAEAGHDRELYYGTIQKFIGRYL